MIASSRKRKRSGSVETSHESSNQPASDSESTNQSAHTVTDQVTSAATYFASSPSDFIRCLQMLMALVRANLSDGRTSNLDKLRIGVKTTAHTFAMECPVLRVDFAHLVGSRLRSIELDLTCFGPIHQRFPSDLLSVLPPTVTYMKISTRDTESVYGLLADPEWLPHLLHMQIGEQVRICPELCTIMSATGKQRPYEYIEVEFGEESILLHPFENTTHLTVSLGGGYPEWLDHFLSFDVSSVPKLKSFTFELDDDSYDMDLMFGFLAQWPLEELDLEMYDEYAYHVLLSEKSIMIKNERVGLGQRIIRARAHAQRAITC